MATITFTAEHDGQTYTRTSGTMPYVAITVGSQVQWHKTMASAYKAATSRTQTYYTGVPATVVPVVPAAINGKLGDWHPEVDGWGDIPAAAFAELVAAKNGAAPAKAAKAVNAKGETPAQARARQRAAKKARESGATGGGVPELMPGSIAKNLATAKTTAQVVADIAAEAPEMVLVRVDGKPQARLDTMSGKLVWRNSAKGRAAREAGLWT